MDLLAVDLNDMTECCMSKASWSYFLQHRNVTSYSKYVIDVFLTPSVKLNSGGQGMCIGKGRG